MADSGVIFKGVVTLFTPESILGIIYYNKCINT